MASRMERYYKGEARSKKNQSLYDKISANGNYTNIKEIVDISNSNEINIDSIKELINGSQNTKHSKSKVVEEEILSTLPEREYEEKNYDVMEVLNKAKNGHSDKDARYRNLKKKQYQILKELKDEHPEDEKIDELMNTMALGDKLEDDLGIFDDLKSNTMVGEEISSIKKIIDEAKDNESPSESVEIETVSKDNEEKIEKKEEIVSSIYDTNNLDDEIIEVKKSDIKVNKKLLKNLLIIFSCLIAVIILVVVAKSIF